MASEDKNQCLQLDVQQRVIPVGLIQTAPSMIMRLWPSFLRDEQVMRLVSRLRPACVLGFFFVKKKENRFRLDVDCRKALACSLLRRLWSCCLETDCRVLMSILVEPRLRRISWPTLPVCRWCRLLPQDPPLWDNSHFSDGPVCRLMEPNFLPVRPSGQCVVRCLCDSLGASILLSPVNANG